MHFAASALLLSLVQGFVQPRTALFMARPGGSSCSVASWVECGPVHSSGVGCSRKSAAVLESVSTSFSFLENISDLSLLIYRCCLHVDHSMLFLRALAHLSPLSAFQFPQFFKGESTCIECLFLLED